MTLPDFLREIVRCPTCRGELSEHPGALHCQTCAVAFPIRDDIPVLLADEAKPLATDV